MVACIDNPWLPTHFTKQHHIIKGARFGQDQTSGPGHIKMAMSGFITGYDSLRIFRPQIKVILGIDSSVTIFENL
jgi:hypothetical protein